MVDDCYRVMNDGGVNTSFKHENTGSWRTTAYPLPIPGLMAEWTYIDRKEPGTSAWKVKAYLRKGGSNGWWYNVNLDNYNLDEIEYKEGQTLTNVGGKFQLDGVTA